MNEPINTSEYFKTENNLRKIFYQKFSPPSEEKANLIITHGLGEHSDAYTDFAKKMCADLKVNIITWDLTGHGKSSGQRGYVGDISWMIDDLKKVIKETKKKSKKPLFLFSHSLGGLLSLSLEQSGFLNDQKIKGLVLSNPCTKLNFEPPKWKTVGADFLTKVAPRMTLGNEISPAQLSSDPLYLKEYKADPMRHSRISPRLFLGMLELIKKLKPFETTTPTLCLLSSQDSICDPENTKELLKNRSQFVFFEHSLHEVLNDIEKETAYQKIKEFLNEHI